MRFLFLLITLVLSFEAIPTTGVVAIGTEGLPELISEEDQRLSERRRSKVLTQSVARKVQTIVEALDEAGLIEDEKTLLIKAKKPEEAAAKDIEIKRVIAKGQKELNDLKGRLDSIKSYDRSMVWYYQAYINLAYADNIKGARDNYLRLINEEDATPQIKLAAYYTLSQLYLSEEDFNNGVKYLLLWFKKTPEVTPQAYVLLGQAYYLLNEYTKAFNNIVEAKNLSDERGLSFRENWYSLLLGCMDELDLKNEQVPVYEEVLEKFPKKKYFVNLAGLYSELERPRDYTGLLKTAYTKQLLDKPSEFQSLSQMLLASGNPYWAAEVMLTGMSRVPGLVVVDQMCEMSKVLDEDGNLKTDRDGVVEELVCTDVYGPAFVTPGSPQALEADAEPILEEDKRNLTILAESLRAAKERDAAIEIFEKLAKVTDDGEAYIAIGNLYYQEDEIDKAIAAIDKGLKKGNLKNPGFAQLTLGQALFEKERFDEAREVFNKATQSKSDAVKKTARSWLKYTDSEQERVKNLNLRRESIS